MQQYSGTQNGQWILSATILMYQMLELYITAFPFEKILLVKE